MGRHKGKRKEGVEVRDDIRLITAVAISGGEEKTYERTVGRMEWASASGQLDEGG